MTKEQRDKAIQTGELQLGNWGMMTHFSIVFFSCFVSVLLPAIHLVKYFQGEGATLIDGEIWIIVIPLILAFLFYRLQKSRLKFKVVDTHLKWPRILEIVESVAREKKWTGKHSDNGVFTAKTDPGFWSGSWGEQITVIFDDGRVLVNSICDLDKRSSVVSFGRNRENMEVLMERIRGVKR